MYSNQQRPSADPRMALAAQLGLFEDPTQQLSGLVQLLAELERPDQLNRELAMREQAQATQAGQFDQSHALAQLSLDRQTGQDDARAQQWTQEMRFKETLAQQEQAMQLRQFQMMQDQSKQQMMLGLLGLSGTNALMQPEVNPAMFNQVAQPYGLSALVPPQAQQQPMPVGMPTKLNPDQQVKLAARQAVNY